MAAAWGMMTSTGIWQDSTAETRGMTVGSSSKEPRSELSRSAAASFEWNVNEQQQIGKNSNLSTTTMTVSDQEESVLRWFASVDSGKTDHGQESAGASNYDQHLSSTAVVARPCSPVQGALFATNFAARAMGMPFLTFGHGGEDGMKNERHGDEIEDEEDDEYDDDDEEREQEKMTVKRQQPTDENRTTTMSSLQQPHGQDTHLAAIKALRRKWREGGNDQQQQQQKPKGMMTLMQSPSPPQQTQQSVLCSPHLSTTVEGAGSARRPQLLGARHRSSSTLDTIRSVSGGGDARHLLHQQQQHGYDPGAKASRTTHLHPIPLPPVEGHTVLTHTHGDDDQVPKSPLISIPSSTLLNKPYARHVITPSAAQQAVGGTKTNTSPGGGRQRSSETVAAAMTLGPTMSVSPPRSGSHDDRDSVSSHDKRQQRRSSLHRRRRAATDLSLGPIRSNGTGPVLIPASSASATLPFAYCQEDLHSTTTTNTLAQMQIHVQGHHSPPSLLSPSPLPSPSFAQVYSSSCGSTSLHQHHPQQQQHFHSMMASAPLSRVKTMTTTTATTTSGESPASLCSPEASPCGYHGLLPFGYGYDYGSHSLGSRQGDMEIPPSHTYGHQQGHDQLMHPHHHQQQQQWLRITAQNDISTVSVGTSAISTGSSATGTMASVDRASGGRESTASSLEPTPYMRLDTISDSDNGEDCSWSAAGKDHHHGGGGEEASALMLETGSLMSFYPDDPDVGRRMLTASTVRDGLSHTDSPQLHGSRSENTSTDSIPLNRKALHAIAHATPHALMLALAGSDSHQHQGLKSLGTTQPRFETSLLAAHLPSDEMHLDRDEAGADFPQQGLGLDVDTESLGYYFEGPANGLGEELIKNPMLSYSAYPQAHIQQQQLLLLQQQQQNHENSLRHCFPTIPPAPTLYYH